MPDYNGLPPEEKLPEESPAPPPGACPPPEEGSAGAFASRDPERRQRNASARQRTKSTLLLAVAGAALCGVIYTAPSKPAAAVMPPVETTAAGSVTEPEPAQSEPTQAPPAETEPAAPTDAERLVAIGTWKNDAESEWVHFNAGGTGWWYDGTYFGRMVWEEGQDGGLSYQAGMAYLGPGQDDTYFPEKEGNCLHSADQSGGIELLPDEDRFNCPGLRFGGGSFLPDDTAIDASVMDFVCGKTAAELISGTSWHMVETSDLGIPIAPSAEGGKDALYTDLIYVQSIDFAACTFVITTRDGGLLEEDYYAEDGSFHTGEPARTFAIPFSLLGDEDETVKAEIKLDVSAIFSYLSDYRPGDTEYNNMHLLWGRSYRSADAYAFVYLLLTDAGIRLGMDTVDLFGDNYTLLALD